MMCQLKSQGWGNELGWCSLTMCRSHRRIWVSYGRYIGMGRRSEQGQATMLEKSFQ
jgi:hypothetical protein